MKRTILALAASALAGFLFIGGIAHGQNPPPPPPPPGGQPATSAPTATPQPTPTQVPLTLSVGLAHSRVSAGQQQKVTVRTLPGAAVTVTVKFPNASRDQITGAANGNGTLTYTFSQPRGVTAGSNHTATVSVKAVASPQSKSSTKKYTIS